jgi:2-polyprenyl-3-methyl-5-hydroxy-6-metoxy-1,4-benzoquinol methylase
MQTIDTPMRRYNDVGSKCKGANVRRTGEEVDYAIVGVGAGGGVLLQRLARAGFHVVGFAAGPFWIPKPIG